MKLRLLPVLLVSIVAAGTITAMAGSSSAADRSTRPTTRPAAAWEEPMDGARGPAPDLTVRNLAKVSIGGSRVRVRLANPYGTSALVVKNAWVGRTIAPGSPQIIPSTNRQLTFAGSIQATIPPGQSLLSDPADITVSAGDTLAVSIYAPDGPVNEHTFPPFAADPPASFMSAPGDHAAESSDSAYPIDPVAPGPAPSAVPGYHPGQTWWLDLVVLDRPQAAGTIVALGDSITDGFQVINSPGHRWIDLLAARMQDVPERRRLSVVSAAISGNTVSDQPNPIDPTGVCCGAPAVKRLDRDVLDVPGLKYVFVLEGTNDLNGGKAAPPSPPEQIIGALTEVAARAHAKGAKVVAGTILPMGMAADSTQEMTRQKVNAWIRSTDAFDSVVDFDAVLRSPANPREMPPTLRFNDIHPNGPGNVLLGTAVPLSAFGITD